jgi:hypothetical protein
MYRKITQPVTPVATIDEPTAWLPFVLLAMNQRPMNTSTK